MKKTASELADQVLEKLALSPFKASKVLLNNMLVISPNERADLLAKYPRVVRRALGSTMPSEGIFSGTGPDKVLKRIQYMEKDTLARKAKNDLETLGVFTKLPLRESVGGKHIEPSGYRYFPLVWK